RPPPLHDALPILKRRLPRQVLPSAEADLEPGLLRLSAEQRQGFERAGRPIGNGDPGQQRLDPRSLCPGKRLAGRAPVEAVSGMVLALRLATHWAPPLRAEAEALAPTPDPSAWKRGRSSPRRSHRPCQAPGRNGRRPPCAHRSAC